MKPVTSVTDLGKLRTAHDCDLGGRGTTTTNGRPPTVTRANRSSVAAGELTVDDGKWM
jgi:hypothetical protein